MFIVSNFDPDASDDSEDSIDEDEGLEYEFSSEKDAEEAAQALADESDNQKWFVWESDDSLAASDEVEEIDGDKFDDEDLDEDEEEDLD
jgi:hypothetical protein